MARPSREHQGGRYEATITFDMPTDKPLRVFLRDYIKDALEAGNAPDYTFTLGQVRVHEINRKEPW